MKRKQKILSEFERGESKSILDKLQILLLKFQKEIQALNMLPIIEEQMSTM